MQTCCWQLTVSLDEEIQILDEFQPVPTIINFKDVPCIPPLRVYFRWHWLNKTVFENTGRHKDALSVFNAFYNYYVNACSRYIFNDHLLNKIDRTNFACSFIALHSWIHVCISDQFYTSKYSGYYGYVHQNIFNAEPRSYSYYESNS